MRILTHASAPRGPIIGLACALVLMNSISGLPPAGAVDIGPELVWETGLIHSISDGDTVTVDVTEFTSSTIAPSDPALRTYCADRLDADGTLPDDGALNGCRVRIIGVQAPEKAGAQGGSALEQCKSSAATAALSSVLAVGARVQLRSIAVTSVEDQFSNGRLARSVYVETGPNIWTDVGRTLSSSGFVMWMPFNLNDTEKPEPSHNLEYRELVDAAATAGRGIWSANLCGVSAAAQVRIWVVSDPIGDDSDQEQVLVVNEAQSPLDLSGWTLRDSSLATFAFPQGTVLAAHEQLRVFTGTGPLANARNLRWGGPSQVFSNGYLDEAPLQGDSAYLYDSQAGWAYGNLRANTHYPCIASGCTDPLTGVLRFGTVAYDPSGVDSADAEFIDVYNSSSSSVDLTGYGLERQGAQWAFPPNSSIAAKSTLHVVVGVGIDSATTVYIGRTSSLLANSGDRLTIARLDHAVLDCRAWGTLDCSGLPVAPTTTVKAKRPTAPISSSALAKKRRIVATWQAPASDGGASITSYRVRVFKKVGRKLRYRATCSVKASKTACSTRKLARRSTYVVKIQAKNKVGYGSVARTSLRLH